MKNYWKDKKVLVTGAAGFIGSNTAAMLVQKGSHVTAVVSPNTTQEKINKSMLHDHVNKIAIKKVDLLNFEDCLTVTKGHDIVLNFAAMDGGVYFKMQYPAKIFRTNSQITLNMLEASARHTIQRFFMPSSIEVYPKVLPTRVNEKYGFREGLEEKTEGYAWAKRFGEIAAKMYYKEHSLPISIARFGNIYGPGDTFNKDKGRVIPTFIHNVTEGKDITIIGDGMQERSFLFVTDLVNALLELVEKYAVCDPVNLASEQYVKMKDLANMVIDLSGKSTKVVHQQASGITLSRKRKISISKAKKIINFKENFSLKEGLQLTLNS